MTPATIVRAVVWIWVSFMSGPVLATDNVPLEGANLKTFFKVLGAQTTSGEVDDVASHGVGTATGMEYALGHRSALGVQFDYLRFNAEYPPTARFGGAFADQGDETFGASGSWWLQVAGGSKVRTVSSSIGADVGLRGSKGGQFLIAQVVVRFSTN